MEGLVQLLFYAQIVPRNIDLRVKSNLISIHASRIYVLCQKIKDIGGKTINPIEMTSYNLKMVER